MFLESELEDCWVNTDHVLYFEIIKDPEQEPDSKCDAFILVANMADGRAVMMYGSTNFDLLNNWIRGYADDIEGYECRIRRP